MFLKYFISNVNADQCWYKHFLLFWPTWTCVNESINQFITMVFHVLNLEINCFLDFCQSNFFTRLWAHSLGHHLLLQKWAKLTLVFCEVVFCDTDFWKDLLLHVHSDLLNLSHTLCNHSQIMIKVLISFLFVVAFSVYFESFGELEDLFFGGVKWEDEDSLDILKGRILQVDQSNEFLYFKIDVKSLLNVFMDLAWILMFVIVIFDKTRVKRGVTKRYQRRQRHLRGLKLGGFCLRSSCILLKFGFVVIWWLWFVKIEIIIFLIMAFYYITCSLLKSINLHLNIHFMMRIRWYTRSAINLWLKLWIFIFILLSFAFTNHNTIWNTIIPYGIINWLKESL